MENNFINRSQKEPISPTKNTSQEKRTQLDQCVGTFKQVDWNRCRIIQNNDKTL